MKILLEKNLLWDIATENIPLSKDIRQNSEAKTQRRTLEIDVEILRALERQTKRHGTWNMPPFEPPLPLPSCFIYMSNLIIIGASKCILEMQTSQYILAVGTTSEGKSPSQKEDIIGWSRKLFDTWSFFSVQVHIATIWTNCSTTFHSDS